MFLKNTKSELVEIPTTEKQIKILCDRERNNKFYSCILLQLQIISAVLEVNGVKIFFVPYKKGEILTLNYFYLHGEFLLLKLTM